MSVLVFQVVTLGWLVTEIVRGVRLRAARRHGDRTAGAAGGAWIVFAAVGLSAAAAVASQRTAVPRLPMPVEARCWVGTVVVVLGVVIRWRAIRTLGRLFTMNVAIREGHEIIQRGLYRWVRHPSYSGLLLSCAGLGIGLGNWASVVICIAGPAAAVLYRIRVEERALRESFPDSYDEYARRTRRLIPGVY